MLQRLREHEADLRDKGVDALWVFGSVARGDARPDSDIHLLIDFAPDAELSLLTLAACSSIWRTRSADRSISASEGL